MVGENNPINVSEQGYDGWNIQSEGNGWYLRSYPTVADGVAAIAAYLSYPELHRRSRVTCRRASA